MKQWMSDLLASTGREWRTEALWLYVYYICSMSCCCITGLSVDFQVVVVDNHNSWFAIRYFLASTGREWRTERSCLSWKKQLRTTLLTWSDIVSLLSMMNPRSRTEPSGDSSAPWTNSAVCWIFINRWREPIHYPVESVIQNPVSGGIRYPVISSIWNPVKNCIRYIPSSDVKYLWPFCTWTVLHFDRFAVIVKNVSQPM